MSDTKFITVFSPYLPPSPLAVSERMRHFIEVLEDNGYTVNVLSGKLAHWGKSLWLDLPSSRTGFFMTLFRETLSGIELAIRMALMKEPCALLTSPPLITTFLGAWGAHMTKKYYFLDVRDLYPNLYFQTGRFKKNSPLGTIFSKMEAWLYTHSAVIFTSSQRICDDIQARYPSTNGRVFNIWNGYDEENFIHHDEKPDTFKILYHGNFGPMNNISLLRKVAQDLHAAQVPVQIDCAGVGPGAALIKGANLENLKVIPPFKPEELSMRISSYHLVLSLRSDGLIGETDFPAKVFESVGAGVPVIVTPKCEAGTYLMDAKAGLQFANNDGGQVVDAIKTFAANPGMLQQMHEAMSKVREALGRRSLRQALVEVLNQL